MIKRFDNIWFLLADMADYTGDIYFANYVNIYHYTIGALDCYGKWLERRISYNNFEYTRRNNGYDFDINLFYNIRNNQNNNNILYPYLATHSYIQQLKELKAFW